jgi:hypothetical protein
MPIVTSAYRYKRPPRKREGPARADVPAIAIPAIITAKRPKPFREIARSIAGKQEHKVCLPKH